MNAVLDIWTPETRARFEAAKAANGVKPRLTVIRRSKRPKRHVDTPEFGRMVTRMIRAYGDRVKDADPEDLAQLVVMRNTLETVIQSTVTHMREHQEFSWSRIGEAFGITKQAAQQRYGR